MINVYVNDLDKEAELLLVMKNQCVVYSDGNISTHDVDRVDFLQNKDELVKEVKRLFECIHKYDLHATQEEVKFITQELETALLVMKKIHSEVEYEKFLKLVEADSNVS